MKSKGFSRSVTFDFDVERVYNKQLGEMQFTNTIISEFDENLEYITVSLTVTGSAWHEPGFYSGAPEDCYPDEGDTEIISVIDSDGLNWDHLLTDDEVDRINSLIFEKCQSGKGCSYEPDDEGYYYDDCLGW